MPVLVVDHAEAIVDFCLTRSDHVIQICRVEPVATGDVVDLDRRSLLKRIDVGFRLLEAVEKTAAAAIRLECRNLVGLIGRGRQPARLVEEEIPDPHLGRPIA